jgi:predicted  nucleic acid-binding Zn-ribbon protein
MEEVREKIASVEKELAEVKEKIKKAEDAGDREFLMKLMDKETALENRATALANQATALANQATALANQATELQKKENILLSSGKHIILFLIYFLSNNSFF